MKPSWKYSPKCFIIEAYGNKEFLVLIGSWFMEMLLDIVESISISNTFHKGIL